jgi:uncharacterized protein DUF11
MTLADRRTPLQTGRTAITLVAAPIRAGVPPPCTSDNGACLADIGTGSVHCDIGDLAVGKQSDITITATPSTTRALPDTGTVVMTGADVHPANNTVTVTVQPR